MSKVETGKVFISASLLSKLTNFFKLQPSEFFKFGFSSNFVGMIERAERSTIVANVFKIAHALGVEAYELFKL